MTEVNIFEAASRSRLRFASNKGELDVEQLWDLPLSSTSASLDRIAIEVNKALREIETESFVSTASNPLKKQLQLKLDVLKHIIEVKMTEQAAAAMRKERSAQRQKLLAALESKETEAIQSMSREDILKKIDELAD